MSELEQVQFIATIVRDIGAPAVIAIGLILFGWRVVRIFGDGDKRSDKLLEMALESQGKMSVAVDALRTTENAKTDLFLRLVNTTDQTYQQLETLTLATESVLGHVDKLDTAIGGVKSKVINIETVMQELRELAEQNKTEHEAATARQKTNSVILNSIQEIINTWPSTQSKIAAIHRIVDEWDSPPPTEPDDQPAASKTGAKVLQIDGVANDATVDTQVREEAS